jgi:hypothetical protein
METAKVCAYAVTFSITLWNRIPFKLFHFQKKIIVATPVLSFNLL